VSAPGRRIVASSMTWGPGWCSSGSSCPSTGTSGSWSTSSSGGRCRTRLPADERLANHLGGVHAIAELAPVELAGALAASTRLAALLERGYVPVVGALEVRYRAPAHGELFATATVGEEVVAPAMEAADAGERPRVEVTVEVTDAAGHVVTVAELRFVYLTLERERRDVRDGCGPARVPWPDREESARRPRVAPFAVRVRKVRTPQGRVLGNAQAW
jgi:hypothetical protein